VEQLFSELRSKKQFGDTPTLFKFHGDFSDRGKAEFVMNHTDYRMMSNQQGRTIDILKHLMSNRSLLFYGYVLNMCCAVTSQRNLCLVATTSQAVRRWCRLNPLVRH
jgi:hypothetical protein